MQSMRAFRLVSTFASMAAGVLVAGAAALAAPDVLVVCPPEFRVALADWEVYRTSQGHEIEVIDSPTAAEVLSRRIHEKCKSGHVKYLLLVGDEPHVRPQGGPEFAVQPAGLDALTTIPTNYIRGQVNIRWGPEREIASDTPYADHDGDGLPDLAVGRIPAHPAQQLAAVIRKEI